MKWHHSNDNPTVGSAGNQPKLPIGLTTFVRRIMAKKKLERFAEMKEFRCLFEPEMDQVRTGNFSLRGRWHEEYFGNDHPITLELGCGKGEYTVELAQRYPRRNFIGVDVKGARLWRGSKTVHSEDLSNVAFIRTKIDFIEALFAPSEVDEIWLTFSDPQPTDHRGTKRLTGSAFLERYRRILRPGGSVHVKTDSAALYHATLKTLNAEGEDPLAAYEDIYGDDRKKMTPEELEAMEIKTFYERKFLSVGKKITYIRFQLGAETIENIR